MYYNYIPILFPPPTLFSLKTLPSSIPITVSQKKGRDGAVWLGGILYYLFISIIIINVWGWWVGGWDSHYSERGTWGWVRCMGLIIVRGRWVAQTATPGRVQPPGGGGRQHTPPRRAWCGVSWPAGPGGQAPTFQAPAVRPRTRPVPPAGPVGVWAGIRMSHME